MSRRAVQLGPVVAALLVACGPHSSTTPVSETPLVAPETPLPQGFGEVELVLGPGKADLAAVQTTIRSRLGEVARCFQVARDLDPVLEGTLGFAVLSEGGRATVGVTGSLASAPASSCAREAFAKIGLPDGLHGFRYILAIEPRSVPKPSPAALSHLARGDLDVVSIAGGPSEAERAAARDDLRACFAGPADERVFVVARVENGKLELVPQPPRKPATSGEADFCVASRLARRLRAWPGISFVAFSGKSGDSKNEGPSEKAELGMIGLLSAGAGGDPNAPTAPWGDDAGDAFGAGGLGLSGIGEGGGGRGEGIGLGTIGHGSGSGTGQGFGSGHGRLGGTRTKPPSVKMGATTVAGRLPPEVIQRIVRQNFGRFRLCYENVLRDEPAAAGTVRVAFTIERDGSVAGTKATGEGWTKGSPTRCVERAFGGLAFPQPEGGVVKVVYPILFRPGDPPPKGAKAAPAAPPPPPAPPPKRKVIDGHTFAELDGPMIAKALASVGFRAITPGKPGNTREAVVFVENDDGTGATVYRRIDGPPTGDCAVTDTGVTIQVDTEDKAECGHFVFALDIGER